MDPRLAAEPNGDDARHAAWMARLIDCDPSAISRALTAAADAGRPLPPFTTDPDTGRRVYPTSEFLAWWDARPRPGRPRRAGRAHRANSKMASPTEPSRESDS